MNTNSLSHERRTRKDWPFHRALAEESNRLLHSKAHIGMR
jgi:hypothetical protein